MSSNNINPKQRIVFFDVVETLFSLAPLETRLAELKLPAGSGRLFFVQLLRDAFALSSSDAFHPFPDIARGTLEVLLANHGITATDPDINQVLGAFSALPAHADVKPALETLKGTGCKVVLLTNGSRANTEKLLHHNGIASLVDDIVSVDDFELWKPRVQLYREAAAKYGCEPENALLVAAHAWDIHGALCAGLHGIWVRRQEAVYHPLMGAPDGEVPDLIVAAELALRLLRL